MAYVVFWFKFQWSSFPRVQLTIIHYWFRLWLGAEETISHYLNQWRRTGATPTAGAKKTTKVDKIFFFKTTLTNAYVECIWADQTTFFKRADAISQNFAAFHVLKLSSGKSRSSESRGCCSVCHILFSVCQNYGCCPYSVASFTDIYYVDQHWG